MTKEEHIREAARAHSNLNTFASIISILEGGHVYGGHSASAEKIIKTCRAETTRWLRIYDKHVAAATAAPPRTAVQRATSGHQIAKPGKTYKPDIPT